MLERSIFDEARKIYNKGENITLHFKDRDLTHDQKQSIIEIAYDFQSGTYSSALKSDENLYRMKQQWGATIADVIERLQVTSICEAGVGEASTLKFIVDNTAKNVSASGFDIAVSRLVYAREFMQPDRSDVQLFAGNLLSIPMRDNAVDALLSNHSLEPNGGQEEKILREMLRVTRRYLILVEPDHERGSDAQKQRMDSLGYIKNIPQHLERLGADIIEYKPWDLNPNPLNAASLIVAEKKGVAEWNEPADNFLASPFSKQPLERRDGYLFSQEDLVAFPVLEGFPCLLPQNAVFASHFDSFTAK